MATYKIVLDGLRCYGVEMISSGRFSSVRGFQTENAAREWIAEQRAADAVTDEAYMPIENFRQSLPA